MELKMSPGVPRTHHLIRECRLALPVFADPFRQSAFGVGPPERKRRPTHGGATPHTVAGALLRRGSLTTLGDCGANAIGLCGIGRRASLRSGRPATNADSRLGAAPVGNGRRRAWPASPALLSPGPRRAERP